MLRGALAGACIYATGCLIPAPLDRETRDPNHQLTIIEGRPAFVPAFDKFVSDEWSFGVTVLDQNAQDMLAGRLYQLINHSLEFHGVETTLTAETDPTVRKGDFPAATYCGGVPPGDVNYYVIVSLAGSFPMNDRGDITQFKPGTADMKS